MSDIIKKRVSESLGKEIKIFLNNGWRYAGKITNTDEQYVEIIDYKTSSYKIIKFEDIKDCEVVR
jgi:sRNA-binding regulator protein Hfq